MIVGNMADRHRRTFRPPLRPDRDLYMRAKEAVHRDGSTMEERFTQWLLWMAGESNEPPRRPGEPENPRPE